MGPDGSNNPDQDKTVSTDTRGPNFDDQAQHTWLEHRQQFGVDSAEPKQNEIRWLLIALVVLVVAVVGVVAFVFASSSSESDESLGADDSAETEYELSDNPAVANLQKSRIDTQRKSDAGRFIASTENFASDNNGSYPEIENIDQSYIDNFITKGKSDEFKDPVTEEQYEFVGSDPPQVGEMTYKRNAKCNESEEIVESDSERDLAVRVALFDDKFYCIDNS